MAAPQKHKDLIIAWANGAEIEFRHKVISPVGGWSSVVGCPSWDAQTEYRLKPEPKPDVVKYCRAWSVDDEVTCLDTKKGKYDNIQLTFDGETGVLKSAEKI